MTRKPSPLAQSALTKRSAGATGTTGTAGTTGGRNSAEEEDEERGSSETASEAGRKPGHRSTPGTSVDSTASTNKPGTVGASGTSLPGSSAAADRAAILQKQGKKSLSNKLRRALSMGAMQEAAMQAERDAGTGGTSSNGTRLASSSASMAGVSVGPSASSGRRFGILNSKANSSTDNLSISSTVSSASVMIRKLGNMGRTARRNSVMGLTKLFKDKDKDKESGAGYANGLRAGGKNGASTSVAQVNAEVDRASTEFPGMTPAAALVQKQKQQYAEQEAAAAAATASAGKSKTTDDLVTADAKLKLLEKDKEKLKSKKGKKWGFGSASFSGTTGSEAAVAAAAIAEDQKNASAGSSDRSEASSDRTPRGSVEVLNDDTAVGGFGVEKSIFDDDASSKYEELAPPGADWTDSEMLDEYDAASLRGYGERGLKPRPSREALPKKGILKYARNFSQEEHINPRRPLESRSRSSSVEATSTQPPSISAVSRVDTVPSEAQVDGVARPASPKDLRASPVPILAPSPYSQPTLNASAPVLPGLSAPVPARSATSPPGARRATFAQNLSVHTTWPPAVYDRRGELATCNRLTPTLAQRIKEELNAYKMEEMEVHYASRVHTHFFL